MALPQFVQRDYGGGSMPALLLNEMGATDTSFLIPTETATSWMDTAGDVLGTNGLFVVAVDAGLPTVEKILCSSMNPSSGQVTAWSSGGVTGRGYDGTLAQTHEAGTSFAALSGVVFPCWTAQEAYEANLLVSQLLGTAAAGGIGSVPILSSVSPPVFACGPVLGSIQSTLALFGGSSGNQTIATGITGNVLFNEATGLAGTTSGWDVSTLLYNVPADGAYLFNMKVGITLADAGDVDVKFGVNSSDVSINRIRGLPASLYLTVANTESLLLNEGDQVSAEIGNATSGVLTIAEAAGQFTRLSVNYLGPT